MQIAGPWLNSIVFGERLAIDGKELASGVWEHAVYLGADEFVYEVEARKDGEEIVLKVDRKKTVADYFRSIVRRIEAARGFPDASDYHHCATLRLAELSWGKEPTGSGLDARLCRRGE
jgi:hypothetical protein